MDNEQSRFTIETNVAAVAENLRFSKMEGFGCTLLIGAGCSYAAGIPLASEFVEIIKELFPDAYKRAVNEACERAKKRGELIDKETFIPSYSNCMAALPELYRRQLFARYVDAAKINWAHICIASLMKAGYVDRILTTNFDSLIVQACSLLGEYPAVYDFASSQHLNPHSIPTKAIFHLHGQRTGFVLLNTEDELEKHSLLLGPLMQAARYRRLWIVVGYSGENDPVFEHIANVKPENYLYWVGYGRKPPRKHIRERLLNKRDTFYVQGYDADSFFEELAKQLGIFPPDLIARPFSHLAQFLEAVSPKGDLIRETHQLIKRAIGQFEKPHSISIITGDFSKVPAPRASQQLLDSDLQNFIEQELPSDRLAWAFSVMGNLLSNRASMNCGEEADKLFRQAAEKYQAALNHKPDYHEARNNWGVSLYYQAKTKSGAESDQLFEQAKDKFREALKQKPNYYEALNNLGAVLYEQAKAKAGEEHEQFLNLAIDNFKAALTIEPNLYQAYNNWGNAILQQCRSRPDKDADQLFELAKEQFEKAIRIESDQLLVLYNWGISLLELLRLHKDNETVREKIENEIVKISDRAEKAKVGGRAYLSACLNALIGDELGCRMALMTAHKSNLLPPREYILNDPNLESVRDEDWFRLFIENAFNQEGEQKRR
jgi:Tfp pilus assembly protein PilF